ncbi:MAG: reverse transcriptase/maturase family protein [Bryobacteraceae bacterium]|nr:reverse transcriptase/maturase family protein [Bryobacteraceae bacterium]
MKRVGGLWPQIVSFENLLAAAHAAAKGKRRRPDVAKFLMNLEPELHKLREELVNGTYQPGPYRTFEVKDPKPRKISAAPFRDRVVHHALTRVIEPVFDRRFTTDCFACRKGFGTHKALERARLAARKYPYVLKCDIRRYFPSIDHEILRSLLARVIKCPQTLELAGRIIDGSNPQEEVIAYYPGDNLFTPFERRRGLPLGNQTSQFFANVYLSPLDHHVRQILCPADYVRYVDDFLVFGTRKTELKELRRRIEEFLAPLRLQMHPGKSRIYRVADGVTFLGWRIFPDRLRLDRGNAVRFRKRLGAMVEQYRAGAVSVEELRTRVRAWIAHANHGDTWQLRRSLFSRYKIRPRSTVSNGVARGFVEQ